MFPGLFPGFAFDTPFFVLLCTALHSVAPHCINRVSLPGKGHPRLDHHLEHLLELLLEHLLELLLEHLLELRLEHLLELRLELDFADTLRVFFEEYFEAYLQHLREYLQHLRDLQRLARLAALL